MPPARITNKRKADVVVSSDDESLSKKAKSPLAGLPQNYYAPPTANMTPEQLQAWRKEQRRERNRQSAAASRQQTKARIAELEGEVLKYKTQYEEMKRRMEGMERQIKLLTEFSEAKLSPKMQMVTPPASYPNSPSRSPVHELEEASLQDGLHPESISIHGFDRQLSNISQASFFSIFDCAPDKIASHPNGASAATAASFIDSKEHLIPISRQAYPWTFNHLPAVKTGATLNRKVEADVDALPVEMSDIESDHNLQVDKVESGLVWEAGVENVGEEAEFDVQGALDSEEEVLDFLAEALDGERFDPDLIV